MKLVRLMVAGFGLCLAACASYGAASGPFKVGDGYTVTLNQTWTSIPVRFAGARHLRLLTVDGAGLNSLYLTDGIPPGQALFARVSTNERRTTDKQVPMARADMDEFELVEFVQDSMVAIDLQESETSDLEPIEFAGEPGVRFRFSGLSPAGLRYSGFAQAMQRGNKVYTMVFFAPEEHYFSALEAEVTKVFDSAHF